MEFTLYGFDVYTSEVDDKGIDFVACSADHRSYFDIQVKAVRNFNYVFFRKEHFGPRKNLLAALVLLNEQEPPQLYLIPSEAWLRTNSLLTSRDYEPPRKSRPEWGINLSNKNYPLLQDFTFDKVVKTL